MFGNVLVQGLKGYGRAKGWKGSKMYVTFELLSDYVKKHVRAQEVDYVPGRGPGVLYELSPIPDNACRLEVTGVSAEGSYSGKVMDSRALWRDFEFEGNSFVMNLRPDDYDIELRHPLFEVVRIDPVPPNLLDLYEPTTAKFELKSPDPTKVRAPLGTESTHVEIQTARDVQITLRNLNTGAEVSGFDTIATAVLPGAYEVRGTEGSLTVAKGKFEFQPGANVTIDLLANRTGSTRGSILKVVNENEAARTVPFSESLGRATADWDLGLWLTLMGASRIVDLPENFRKLGKLPLETFYDVRQSDSPVYVLSAFESSAGSPRMALGKSRMVSWRPMNTVSKLDGVYHGVIHQLAGKNFLSIELPSKKAITVPTETFENRATLVVVVEERQVPLRLYQFVLPLGRLARNIDPQVWGLFERLPLPVVRTMFYEQRRFLYADPFEPDTEQAKHLRALIDSPVPDPIMARVACYDLLRDNRAMRAMFPIRDILKRLRKEFGINGDTEAISRLIGMDWTSPDSPPLFLEGLLSFSGETLAGPLSDDKIDYACPWSAWTNAIEAHETPPLTKSAGAGA
jgi:hypothetical protein